MSLLNKSSEAWKNVQKKHSKLENWSFNSVKSVQFLGQEHLRFQVTNRKTNERAIATVGSDMDLVIDEQDPMDVFNVCLCK